MTITTQNTLELTEKVRKYSLFDWLNWLDDMLEYDHAFPQPPRKDSMDDYIDVMMKFLVNNNIPTETYQIALFRKIKYLLESNVLATEKDLERLLWPLQSLEVITVTTWLIKAFITGAYEKVKYDNHSLQSELLQLLSHSKLSSSGKGTIKRSIREKALRNIGDPIFCSGWLRFVRRQEPDNPKQYFDVFKNILEMMRPEQYTHPMRVLLLDKVREFKNWYNDQIASPLLDDLIAEGEGSVSVAFRTFVKDAQKKFTEDF